MTRESKDFLNSTFSFPVFFKITSRRRVTANEDPGMTDLLLFLSTKIFTHCRDFYFIK